MPLGAATSTPIGWLMFCRDNRAECQAQPGEGAALPAADAAFLALVGALNAQVNAAVKPVTDRVLYGVEERWTYPGGRGDCEDYALAKRRALNAAGVPLAALLMTVVRKADGEGHAILTLRTTGGDFVLDNLDRRVRGWTDTNYTFVKRQSSADPNVWLAVANTADVAVGAVKR